MKVYQNSFASATSVATEPHISKVRVFAPNNNNTQKMNANNCSCPNVLVADDDSFQHMYYKIFFERTLNFDGLSINKETFKLHLSFSGEEMLAKLAQIKACGCKSLKLVISDYFMGNNNLNGVATCLKVRENGYTGPVLLRTSETQEHLNTQHENFSELLEEEVINQVLSKTEVNHGKEVIRNILMA